MEADNSRIDDKIDSHISDLNNPHNTRDTNIPAGYVPLYYSNTNGFLIGHLQGVDNKINDILTGDTEFTGDVSFAGNLDYGDAVQPPIIAANQDNYAPTGIQDSILFLIGSSGSFRITGIEAPASGNTVIKHFFNVGANNITFMDNDAGSLAENRLFIDGNKVLQPNKSIALIYENISNVWRLQINL